MARRCPSSQALALSCAWALLVIAGIHAASAPWAWPLAAACALLGAVVERWLFFAEARHVATLYY